MELCADIRGIEIVGVCKNILSLGAGIADGLYLGENFKSTYIARGVKELSRVISLLGGDPKTLSSIGALSDIILTCSSDKSRNYRLGRKLSTRRAAGSNLAEGHHSVSTFLNLLSSSGISSNFFECIGRSINSPPEIIDTLSGRA